MSKYRPEKTRTEVHLERLQAFEEATVLRLSQANAELNAGHGYLWGLPDAELEELMNHLGHEKVTALMTDHGTLGTVTNAVLASLENPLRFTRARIGAGREVTWDGERFSVVPLPEPEPEQPTEPPAD
jgi:hypothetical protein